MSIGNISGKCPVHLQVPKTAENFRRLCTGEHPGILGFVSAGQGRHAQSDAVGQEPQRVGSHSTTRAAFCIVAVRASMTSAKQYNH